MPIPTPQERLGQLINGRYRLESLLSTGGMGVVFRGFDERDQTAVAVKTLKPAYALEPERVARFLREIRITERVKHSNIARTLDASNDDTGAPFLILELLDGRTLQHELAQRGTMPLDEAVAIALPIMRALSAAHALGVIHRDVKPSNIFLSTGRDGCCEPKLLDFGIAKSDDANFETQTGMFVGSPGYVAPEQAQYAECSPETDVWAMGAVLYRCLTGYAPHTEAGDSDVFSRLIRDPVPPLRAAGVSRRACASIERALARDPSQRYASMTAFAEAMEEFAGSEPCADTAELALVIGTSLPMAEKTRRSERQPLPARGWRPGLKSALLAAACSFAALPTGSSATRERAPAGATTMSAAAQALSPVIAARPAGDLDAPQTQEPAARAELDSS